MFSQGDTGTRQRPYLHRGLGAAGLPVPHLHDLAADYQLLARGRRLLEVHLQPLGTMYKGASNSFETRIFHGPVCMRRMSRMRLTPHAHLQMAAGSRTRISDVSVSGGFSSVALSMSAIAADQLPATYTSYLSCLPRCTLQHTCITAKWTGLMGHQSQKM